MKKASDFKTALKQKLLPDFTIGPVPQVPSSSGQAQLAQPKTGLAGQTALRLGLGEILAPGGIKGVEDISTEYWFSALQPIQPVAPASYRPRQRGFLPGENLIWTPGEDKGGITFEHLRALADSWDLLRIVIETRKDQLCRMDWEIRKKKEPGQTNKQVKEASATDPIIKQLNEFFQHPDGYHTWDQWLRLLFEDTLVLDATALYYARDLNGKIASVIPIDGATINRCITDQGLTPPPPSVAYQQVVYGSPACDLTTDDMLYVMRNERTHRRYGYSPVEQILVTIAIGLRREDFVLKYYTDGNMPEGLCFLPANITPARIKEIQDWFDSVLAGDLAKRRRLTFLPGFGNGGQQGAVSPNVVFPKEPLLKDQMDEWLMQIVCTAFSISPQNFMKQMNRATAEQSAANAQEEGQEPAMSFACDIANCIIKALGFSDDYEFAWKEKRDTDPKVQADIDNILVGKLYTINEIREMRGDDPRPEPEADMLGMFGATGFIPLGQQPQQAQINMDQQQAVHDNSMEAHQMNMSSQQQNMDLAQQQADQPAEKVTKLRILDKVAPGEFEHPVYGDLSKHDKFFAYDPDTDEILVKGDVDVNLAYSTLRKYYPDIKLASANGNGHKH